jgi:hypothetical protein
MNSESSILYETKNLYLYRKQDGSLEIRRNGAVGSVVVGNPRHGVERAKLTMKRLEVYPDELRKFLGELT